MRYPRHVGVLVRGVLLKMNLYRIIIHAGSTNEKWAVVDLKTNKAEFLTDDYETAHATRKVLEDAYDDVLGSIMEAGLLNNSTQEERDWYRSEDAKLSSKKRKELPDSAFCGPNRSFPTHDCAHVRAAARLLSRAKLSSSQKAKVRACISRKNKSQSCGVEMGDD